MLNDQQVNVKLLIPKHWAMSNSEPVDTFGKNNTLLFFTLFGFYLTFIQISEILTMTPEEVNYESDTTILSF